MSADLVKRCRMALHDMQGRVEASKLGMFDQCINALSAKDAEIAALRAKLARAVDEMNITTLIAHALDDGAIDDTHYREEFSAALDAMNAALADLATDTGGGKE